MMSLSAGKGGENWRKFAQMKIYLFSLLAALGWHKRMLKWQLARVDTHHTEINEFNAMKYSDFMK